MNKINIVKCPSCSHKVDLEQDEIQICDNNCGTIICNNYNKEYYNNKNIPILGHSINCGNNEYNLEDYNKNDKLNFRIEQMETIQKESLELFKRKNADYGDAFAKYGIIGVLMRIEDKIQRSLSITKNGVNLVKDESIRDTLLDLHNYAAMGLMLLDEK